MSAAPAGGDGGKYAPLALPLMGLPLSVTTWKTTPEGVMLSDGRFAFLALAGGAVLWLACVAAAKSAAKERGYDATVISIFACLWLFCLPVCVYLPLDVCNRRLDQAPPVMRTAAIVGKRDKFVSHNGHDCFVTVSGPFLEKPLELPVSEGMWRGAAPGATMTLGIKPGRLGSPWIASARLP